MSLPNCCIFAESDQLQLLSVQLLKLLVLAVEAEPLLVLALKRYVSTWQSQFNC
jgi:DNA-binding helix-hairpin-helix protein with protein kinase domain